MININVMFILKNYMKNSLIIYTAYVADFICIYVRNQIFMYWYEMCQKICIDIRKLMW